MKKAVFNEYNREMNELSQKDPETFQKAMERNNDNIRKTSKYPQVSSLIGGWSFLALFLLTGFLSGWTVGVLWVVATISGAGILGSAVAGLVGHFKYHKYFRALKTREKLMKLRDDKENHFDQERLKLERKLNRDLDACRKKRLISDAEYAHYRNVLPRPQVLAEDAVAQKKAEISAEANKMSMAMQSFKDDTNLIISEKTTELSQFREDNIEPNRRFEGAIQISAQARDEEGKPVVDENGAPVNFDNRFDASSDKDFAVILDSISQKLKERLSEGALPFPVTIECYNKKGQLIDIVADGKGQIVFTNGDMLISDTNPLESTARSIYERLPIKDQPEQTKVPIEEQEAQVQEEEHAEQEQAQTR